MFCLVCLTNLKSLQKWYVNRVLYICVCERFRSFTFSVAKFALDRTNGANEEMWQSETISSIILCSCVKNYRQFFSFYDFISRFSLSIYLFNPRLFSASQPRNAINRYERCYLYVAYDCVFVCLVMYFAVLHIYNPTMHKHVVLCVLSFSVYALCYTLYARRITFIFEKSALSLSHTFSRAHTTTTTTKLFRDNFRPEMKICVHRRK